MLISLSIHQRPVHMEVGDLRQPIYPYNLSFFRVHMLGEVPHQGGLPGQPVRVTRFVGVSFLRVKASKWDNPSNRGNRITRGWRVISTISPPKR